MTMFLVSISSTLPSSPVTDTLPAATTLPVPRKLSILFFLNRKATPLTLDATVASLCAIIFFRLSFGVPTSTPSVSKEWPASANISEAWSSALDGMQPMLRQVPPKVASLLDHRRLQAELRRLDGADIAARSRSDDNDVISHDTVPSVRPLSGRRSHSGSRPSYRTPRPTEDREPHARLHPPCRPFSSAARPHLRHPVRLAAGGMDFGVDDARAHRIDAHALCRPLRGPVRR